MPLGRPSDYTPQLATAICARIAGGESLKRVCSAEEMPDRTSVYDWLNKYPDFANMYARAKEDSADVDADDIKDISDDLTEDPQSRKVRIDARKWIASKLKPKKYGDRIDATVAHTGGLTITIAPTDSDL